MSEGEAKATARYKPLAKKVGGSSPLGPTSVSSTHNVNKRERAFAEGTCSRGISY